MRELTITANDAGQRLDRFLQKALPRLPGTLVQKYIRTKRIKVDGKRTERSYRLSEGDTIQLYIGDEFFEQVPDQGLYRSIAQPNLSICYEDEHLLLVNKAPGILCHSSTDPKEVTLVDLVKAYLYQSSAWNPDAEQSFVPALSNRLDRNTGGLVIAAKSAVSQRILNEKLRAGEIDKYYLLAVQGRPVPDSGRIEGHLVKDRANNIVHVAEAHEADAKAAVLEYQTLKTAEDLSLVECKLITGRSHQIRVQMASLGTPILGDRKYGGGTAEPYQALWAYRLRFAFTSEAGALEYLNGREFRGVEPPFVRRYFGI